MGGDGRKSESERESQKKTKKRKKRKMTSGGNKGDGSIRRTEDNDPSRPQEIENQGNIDDGGDN